jgi:hypothetical protein
MELKLIIYLNIEPHILSISCFTYWNSCFELTSFQPSHTRIETNFEKSKLHVVH